MHRAYGAVLTGPVRLCPRARSLLGTRMSLPEAPRGAGATQKYPPDHARPARHAGGHAPPAANRDWVRCELRWSEGAELTTYFRDPRLMPAPLGPEPAAVTPTWRSCSA